MAKDAPQGNGASKTPQANDNVPRQRSPNFPAFSLKRAVEKAETLFKQNKRFLVHGSAALKLLGYNTTKSSGALQNVGALKAFGLIETEGSGEDRQIKVSEAGARIVLNHPDRPKLLKEAALLPPLFSQVWNLKTDDGLPSDDAIRHYLLWEQKFNESAIPTFIASFRESLAFAGLGSEDKISNTGEAGSEGKGSVKVGDLVQWTSAGVDQFPEPRPVRGFSDDGEYAFVPGTDSGLPVGELTVVSRAMNDADKKVPPSNPFKESGGNPAKSEQERRPLPLGFKEAVLPQQTGEIVIRWPARLSSEEVQDFEEWIPILIRKMKRAAQNLDENE